MSVQGKLTRDGWLLFATRCSRMFAYGLLFESLGFVVSTTLMGFGLGMLFNGRLLPSLASGLLMGALLYGLFDYLLNVPLPLGLLVFLEN